MIKRALITGSGGFLGSHIARYFGEAGHSIAAVGRFTTTPDLGSLYPNLWKLCGMTLPDERFFDVIKAFQPELLVHCAGTASVADSVIEPYSDFQRTVEVCAFTLEAVRRFAPDCCFILLSSAAVYGNPQHLPIAEDAPCKPASPYGYHKLMCEALVEEYSQLHGLNAATVRIFSAYGERLMKQVIFDLCRKFNDPSADAVELFGTGNESRDFIHANDIAQAIEILNSSNACGVYNLASGVQTTIAELAGLIGQILNSHKEVHFNGENRFGDPLYWQADITRISSLGFKCKIELEKGLVQYVEWLKTLQS